jgi:hypothetical protein
MINLPILVDDIVQVYSANGIRHIILGVASGEINKNGIDITKPALRLAVPEDKVGHIAELLKQALEVNLENDTSSPTEPPLEDAIVVGQSIFTINT